MDPLVLKLIEQFRLMPEAANQLALTLRKPVMNRAAGVQMNRMMGGPRASVDPKTYRAAVANYTGKAAAAQEEPEGSMWTRLAKQAAARAMEPEYTPKPMIISMPVPTEQYDDPFMPFTPTQVTVPIDDWTSWTPAPETGVLGNRSAKKTWSNR